MDKIVQINLNGQVGSNDLILQFMREKNVTLAAISEPHSVPDDPGWVLSPDGSTAITWRGSRPAADCSVVVSEMGVCAIRWREIIVCSCYFSPSKNERVYRVIEYDGYDFIPICWFVNANSW